MDDFKRKPINKVSPAAPSLDGVQPVAPAAPENLSPSAPQEVPVRKPGWASPIQQPENPNSTQTVEAQPISEDTGLKTPKKKKSWKKKLLWWLLGIVLLIAALLTGAWFWYNAQLAPVDASNTDKKVVSIESGSTPNAIASTLKSEGLIRNETIFLWYTRINGVQNKLQAGSYRLSPSESTQEIVEHLSNGKVDTFSITFLPGATLKDNKEVLLKAGYSDEEVDTAFAQSYQSPLFEGKPATADLEGYIYGETYSFGTDASVESILKHTFEQFYGVIEKNGLVEKYKAQGLTLYQGIILASIVQREASPSATDMSDIAQVFYNRLAEGMNLGSDVTYQYIADKEGIARDVNLDSPYNTRIKQGLPPGPISAPGEKALVATANPSGNDYLFFLSGDDDITYYGRTAAEHEANIRNHCQKKCQII